jgi:hypothetical protein
VFVHVYAMLSNELRVPLLVVLSGLLAM